MENDISKFEKNTQTRADSVYIRTDHPDAKEYISVAGRCYKKTNQESTDFEITTENIFGGLLTKENTTIVNPHDDYNSTSKNDTRVTVDKFSECEECTTSAEKFRNQLKKNYRDYSIVVYKEKDDSLGDVITYRLSGEDRLGKFKLKGIRSLVFSVTDSVTFDVRPLGADAQKFTLSGGLTSVVDKTSRPGFVILGQPRYFEYYSGETAPANKPLPVGNHTYSESGNNVIKGTIKIEQNKFNQNPEYSDEKLKQFPDRLHSTNESVLLIKNDGSVEGVGDNKYYQLGIYRDTLKHRPFNTLESWTNSEISNGRHIKKLVGKHLTYGAITNDNKFYIGGYNGKTFAHNLARNSNGDFGKYGQIKIDHANADSNEIYLGDDIHTQIVDADIGAMHGIALDVNQRLWIWGHPHLVGPLLIKWKYGDHHNDKYQTDLTKAWKYTSRNSWDPANWGTPNSPFARAKLCFWDDDLARDTNTAFLTDKTLFNLQLPENKIYQVACTHWNTYILTLDGAVYSCGLNDGGQLGQKHNNKFTSRANHTPGGPAATSLVSGALHDSFGLVYNTGTRLLSDNQNDNDIHVKKIITGSNQVFLLTFDNKLYGFGSNTHGRLGLENAIEKDKLNGNFDFANEPILIAENVYRAFAGMNSSAYITFDGTVYVTGYNLNGKLGIDRFAETAPVPSKLESSKIIERWSIANRLMGAVEITMNHYNTHALLSNGQIICLGDQSTMNFGNLQISHHHPRNVDEYDKLRDSDYPINSNTLSVCNRNIKFDTRLPSMHAVNANTIIHSAESNFAPNRVESCGHNGQWTQMYGTNADTGDNGNKPALQDVTDFLEDTVLANGANLELLRCSPYYTYLLNDKGEAYVVGSNAFGQPTKTPSRIKFKGEPVENVKLMDTGYFSGAIVDSSNRLYITGNPGIIGCGLKTYKHQGLYGANTWHATSDVENLYNPNTKTRKYTTRNSWDPANWTSFPNVWVTDLVNEGQGAVLPDEVGRIIDVRMGRATLYILNEAGQLYSAGDNWYGQLGQRNSKRYIEPSKNNEYLHPSFGAIYSFNGFQDIRVKRVVPGDTTCFVILEDNSLWGWGRNEHFQLGKSAENSPDAKHHHKYYSPVHIADNIDDVWTGPLNTAYKTVDGDIYVMGDNRSGLMAMWADGRELGLDRHNKIDGIVKSTEYAKNPIPWHDASDNIVEISFGNHHAIIKQIDRTAKKINYYSSGSNAYGERGIDIAPGGGNTYDEVYDVPSENYAGADRWARMRSVLFPV